jgi:indolepyruvate ferredoxin oxidoreductase, alpha subunit
LITEFLKGCEKVLIIEEGEPYMEESIKAIAQEAGLTIPIKGKAEELFSRLFEFDPGMVRKNIARYFDISYSPSPRLIFPIFRILPTVPPTFVRDVLIGRHIMR